MTKPIHTFTLIRGKDEESYLDFKTRIMEDIQTLSKSDNILASKLTITEEKPPAISTIPFGKSKIAAISIHQNQIQDKEAFEGIDGYSGSFLVEEALPVEYDKTWDDKTPGVCLLSLFRKKKNISYDTFIDRWHNGHTPLSLEIHPLWHYSRNVVKEGLGDGEIWYDGIVEEHCRTRSELMNPTKFFGNVFMMLPNMIRVYLDVKSFLDYSSIEPYLVSEYYIKHKKK